MESGEKWRAQIEALVKAGERSQVRLDTNERDIGMLSEAVKALAEDLSKRMHDVEMALKPIPGPDGKELPLSTHVILTRSEIDHFWRTAKAACALLVAFIPLITSLITWALVKLR